MELLTRMPSGVEKLMEYSDEDVAKFVKQAEGWTSYIKDVMRGGENTFDNGQWNAGEKIIEVPLEIKDYVIKNGELWGFMPHDFLIWVEDEWMVCPDTYDGHLYKIEGMHNWTLLLDAPSPDLSHRYYRKIKKVKKD